MLFEGQNDAVSILQWNDAQGFSRRQHSRATRFAIAGGTSTPARYTRRFTIRTGMQPSRLGIEYLLPIFTDAIGPDDAEHMRQTMFDEGNLFRPYHSVNTDVNKRIRCLED